MINNIYYDLQKKYETVFLKNNSIVTQLKFDVSHIQYNFFKKSPEKYFDISLANKFYFFLDELLKSDVMIAQWTKTFDYYKIIKRKFLTKKKYTEQNRKFQQN